MPAKRRQSRRLAVHTSTHQKKLDVEFQARVGVLVTDPEQTTDSTLEEHVQHRTLEVDIPQPQEGVLIPGEEVVISSGVVDRVSEARQYVIDSVAGRTDSTEEQDIDAFNVLDEADFQQATIEGEIAFRTEINDRWKQFRDELDAKYPPRGKER